MNYHQKFDKFYRSLEWKRLRKAYINSLEIPVCEECLKIGKVTEGKIVHHIIPIEVDWDKRLDNTNLEYLCNDCHEMIHNRGIKYNKFLSEFNKIGGKEK